MTTTGWVFMCGSLALVWTLAIWCYARVLRGRVGSARDDESEE